MIDDCDPVTEVTIPNLNMVCRLLGSAFNYVVQLSLGLIALSILYFKYRRERPQRVFSIWLKDVSKQIGGLLWAHLLNLLLAMMLAEHDDQCVPYFVNYIIDSTIGVALNLLLLWGLRWVGHRYQIKFLDFGNYNDQMQESVSSADLTILAFDARTSFRSNKWAPLKMWFKQLFVWMGIITLIKLFLFFSFIYPLREQLMEAGSKVLHGITSNDVTELMIVMIIVPLIVNICQFIVQDNCLKRKPDTLDLALDSQLDVYYDHLTSRAGRLDGPNENVEFNRPSLPIYQTRLPIYQSKATVSLPVYSSHPSYLSKPSYPQPDAQIDIDAYDVTL